MKDMCFSIFWPSSSDSEAVGSGWMVAEDAGSDESKKPSVADFLNLTGMLRMPGDWGVDEGGVAVGECVEEEES